MRDSFANIAAAASSLPSLWRVAFLHSRCAHCGRKTPRRFHVKLSSNIPNPTASDEQLVRDHAGLDELLLDREETLRRDEYVEALVEQAHKDALQERASIFSELQQALADLEAMRAALEKERRRSAQVGRVLA